MGPLEDAPGYHVCKDDQHSQHDSNEELLTKTPTKPEGEHMFTELRTKQCMEQGACSRTTSTMEVQLNQLIKEVENATDAAIKEMTKSTQVGFMKLRTKIDSLYHVVLK